ncbi:MAG: hypothetical protein ACYTFQ_24320 [Planctomycetota bacterium]|jgi:hypothetical protein
MSVPRVKVLRGDGDIAIVPIHYSMDPEKDREWAIRMRKRGIADDWEKELEINFESVMGARCFENFNIVANVDPDVEYNPNLPLRLGCDFNVQPMAWEIAQIQANEELHFIDEIYLKEGSTEDAVEVFLDRYGDHYCEVFVYGDATGKNRSPQNLKTHYRIIKDRFRGMPFPCRMRVPSRNPSNVNHVNAFNERLRDKFGNPRIKIHPTECPELIRDMTSVIWQPEGKHIKKERSKPDNPYFWRTHCADAAMAIVYRHWPMRVEENRKSKGEKEHDKRKRERQRRNKRKKLIGSFPMAGDRHGRR